MLHPGLYEQVINNALTGELAEIPEARKSVAPIDKAEASKVLAQYMAGCTCYAATGTLPLSPEDHQFLQSEVLPRTADRYDKRP